jgi:hypothetical protein
MQYLLKIPRPLFVPLVVSMCILTGSGCGGSKEKVVSVTGKVTHNGTPIDGLVISFVPVEQTETGVSTGTTDENGKYDLTVFLTGRSGAVVGTHKVWVSRPREPFVDPADKEEIAKLKKLRKKAPPTTSRPPAELAEILKKYGSLDNSKLTIEVKGGEQVNLKLD